MGTDQTAPEAANLYGNISVIAESVPDPQGMTWIAGALAGIEAALANPLTFQTYCRQIQAQRPELPLAQWWLEPATPNFRVRMLEFSVVDSVASPLQSPRWVDPLGDCVWTAANALVIQAANHRDLWVNNVSAPRLLWSVAGDFALQVICHAAEADRPAIGGLLLWLDQENYLRLTWGEYGAASITLVGCIGNADQILGRGRLAHTGQVHLRLERGGMQVRALCRADGQAWFCVGEVAFSAADGLAVGVHAIGKIDRTFYPGAYPMGTAIQFTPMMADGYSMPF